MTARGRLPLLALLWLLTAAGAGLLFGWLLRPDPEVDTRFIHVDGMGGAADSPPGAPPPAHSPASPLPGGASPAGTPPLPGPEGGPAEAARPAPPPPASVLVTILDADGSTPGDGVVYALGAGEEGADDEEFVFPVYLEEPGPVRLRLPRGGLYDIGFRNERGATLLRDVSLAPGDGNEVILRVPAGLPVRVQVEGEWPPEGSEGAVLLVDLWTEDLPGQVQVEFPGRHDRGWASGFAAVTEATGFTGPLQAGRVYHLAGRVQEVRPHWEADRPEGRRGRRRLDSPLHVAEADRETVRPGETVVFRIRKRAALAITLSGEFPPAEGRKDRSTSLVVTVLRDGAIHAAVSLSVQGDGASGIRAPGALVGVEPGNLALRWSGQGLQAGSREGIEAGPGEVVELEIPVREDPRGRYLPPTPPPVVHGPGAAPPVGDPQPPPLEVEVAGMPPESEAAIITCFRGEDGEWEEWEDCVGADGDGTGKGTLDPSWRTAPEAAAVLPPRLASPFVPLPASGPLRLALEPAGLLLVAPGEVPEEGFGTLRLRRTDGRPIPVTEEGGRSHSWASREMEVWAGTLLGPFPEGTITFEVRLGGLRLPDARAAVKAGRVVVLRIDR